MSDEIRLDGLGLKPGVLERIVTLAATHVDGVSSVYGQGLAGLVQKSGASRCVEVTVTEQANVSVRLHVEIVYGRPLHTVAAAVQDAVAEAIRSQIGTEVDSVDVFVDAVAFAE